MSKKTPAERPQNVKNGAPEAPPPVVGAATPAPEPVPAAPTPDAAAPASAPEPDYRALYEQANDRCLRTRADFDNYRKRMQREVAEIRFQVIMQTVAEFLRLYDQLGLALEHSRTAEDAPAIRQGLDLTRAEFDRILATLGVTRIVAAGALFDPAVHEAIAQEASAVQPAGTVLREWKPGFVLGGRLLRPATVSVSSGPATAAVADSAAADAAGNRKE